MMKSSPSDNPPENGDVTISASGVELKELPPDERGLVLWKILNQHDVERPDPFAVTIGESPQALQRVNFDFQQKLDWQEWKSVCIPRLKYAAKFEVPHLPELLPHDGKMTIVGAGPSASSFIEEIRKAKDSPDNNLMSINATHNWLIENGIIPRIHVISEFDFDDVKIALGGPPHKDVTYYVASTCSSEILRTLIRGRNRVVIWHPFFPFQGYQQAINKYFKNEFMVSSGFSTFFKSLAIATVLGFRHFDLFGLDSSCSETTHLDGYAMADKEPKIEVWAGDQWGNGMKKFTTLGGLAFQAKEFLEFCKYNHSGLKLRVYGDGLLRHLHKSRYPDQY